MKKISVEGHGLDHLHGAIVRAVQCETSLPEHIGFVMENVPGAPHVRRTIWLRKDEVSATQVVDIIRSTWRATWHLFPEEGSPDKGLLQLHKR